MPTRIQLRRGTTAQWAASDPVLSSAEAGFDTTVRKHKMGDGMSAWSALGWASVLPDELTDAVAAAVSDLVTGAPGALDTLNELAAALGDDANFASTVMAAIAAKVSDTAFAGSWNGVTDVAPSKNAVYDALGAYVAVTSERLSLIDPRVAADNTGATPIAAAMTAALALMPARGGAIYAPPGAYLMQAQVVIPAGVAIEGAGYASATGSGNRGATCFVKDGNFDAFKLAGRSVLRMCQVDGAGGNGGDGVYVGDGGRCVVEDVAVTSQGGVGFRFGDKTSGKNVNLWRAKNLIALGNGSHGVYVHDADTPPATNVNRGLLEGLDSRSNGGDGIQFGNVIDCDVYGLHAASNTGRGWHLASGATGIWLYSPYDEANTAGGGLIDSGAEDNVIFGVRSRVAGDGYTDNGARNLILGRKNATGRFTWLGRSDFDQIAVGQGSALTLVKSRTFTWDPASIAAGSYVENEVAFTEALTTDTFTVSLSSQGGYQILFYGQCSSAGFVKVLAFNATGSAIDRPSGTLTITLIRTA